MPTPLYPQEVFLLERYSSAEYFSQLRDAWHQLTQHVEDCLDLYQRNKPLFGSFHHLSEQPDIVWGERVLPNFLYTRDQLDSAFIKLQHGNPQSAGSASGVVSDVRGQRDSSTNWFTAPPVTQAKPDAYRNYYDLLYLASRLATNISTTIDGRWPPFSIGVRYNPDARGPLNAPAQWPCYRLRDDITVKTDDIVQTTGVYLPLLDESSPQWMIAGNRAVKAQVGRECGQTRYKQVCTWALVERVPDSYTTQGLHDLLATADTLRLRVEDNQS